MSTEDLYMTKTIIVLRPLIRRHTYLRATHMVHIAELVLCKEIVIDYLQRSL